MTAEQFNASLVRLGWSWRYLAAMLDCSPTLVARWAAGTASIPAALAAWLASLASFHVKHPPPDDWRVR